MVPWSDCCLNCMQFVTKHYGLPNLGIDCILIRMELYRTLVLLGQKKHKAQSRLPIL